MKGMELMSLDCWKIHFQHPFQLEKHGLYFNDKHDFFCKYYGLMINLYKIDHTGHYGAGYQRNGNYLQIVNEHGQNNYKRLLLDLHNWF